MKALAFALLSSFLCLACARQLTTLSDGQPGYAITCDTYQDRCLGEITKLCGANNYVIVSERANEIGNGWRYRDFTSRYWLEARCLSADQP